MIKTYKQWMNTMYEAVQSLNEGANQKADVSQFFSKYYEFFNLPEKGGFATDQGKSASIFNTMWSRTANATNTKFGERGGDALRTRALLQIEKLLNFSRKSEMTKDRKAGLLGTKSEEGRQYAKVYGGNESEGIDAITGYSSVGRHRNAQNGLVQLDYSGTSLPIMRAGSNKEEMVSIYDLIHEINMKNLRLATQAATGLADLRNSKYYPSAKSMSKGFNETKLEAFKTRCGNIKCITEITGSSIGVGSLKQSDEVSGLNRKNIRFSSEEETKQATIDFPLYYVYSYSPGSGMKITDGKIIYKKIETQSPDTMTDYSIPIAGIDKMFAQGKNTLNDGYNTKLAAVLKKTLDKFDAISSIVVKGGASFEWSGGARDDAKNKNLAEQRAQTVLAMIKNKYPNLAVTTAGAEAAVIQPDEDAAKVEQYRKVYLEINGHQVTSGEIKEVTIKEIETASFKKDSVYINSKIFSITVDITA